MQLTVVGIGLGAIFATSPSAFLILQWAGVLYLVWIGVSKLIWPRVELVAGSTVPKSVLLIRAILINIMNPKAFVFLAAFFPQFINQSAGDPA